MTTAALHHRDESFALAELSDPIRFIVLFRIEAGMLRRDHESDKECFTFGIVYTTSARTALRRITRSLVADYAVALWSRSL